MGDIYTIKNEINCKLYVGSASNVKKRWYDHEHYLDNNSHVNNHLQNSWNKYGKENFKFSIIEENVPNDLLLQVEQKWMDFYKRENQELYNIALYAASPMKGRTHSEESINKISDASKLWHINTKGTDIYDEYLSNLSKSLMGHVVDIETRNKISISHMGKMIGEDNPFYGKKHTDESKIRMSEKHTKLSKLDVLEILMLLKQGEKITYVSKIFNMRHPDVIRLRNEETFKYIERTKKIIIRQSTLNKLDIFKKYMEIKNTYLSVINIYKIKILLFKYKIAIKEIAKIYNTYPTKISNIKNGKILSWVKITDLNVDEELYLIDQNSDGNLQKRKVICLTTGEIFKSISEISKKYNISLGNISTVCRGRAKSAGKCLITNEPLMWMYYDNYLENKDNIKPYQSNKSKHNLRKVVQFSPKNIYINEYCSLSEASRLLNINPSAICACCKGKRNSAGGYKWMYCDVYIKSNSIPLENAK